MKAVLTSDFSMIQSLIGSINEDYYARRLGDKIIIQKKPRKHSTKQVANWKAWAEQNAGTKWKDNK